MISYNQQYTIPNGGGTITLNLLTDQYHLHLFRGTATLSSGYTIQPSGVPTTPTRYRLFYNGNVTYTASNVITVFGRVLTQEQALKGSCLIEIVYDFIAAAWAVSVTEGFDTDYEGMTITDMNLAGDTITLNSNSKQVQYFRANGVLAGNYAVTFSGTFRDGQTFFLKVAATLTINASALTFLGVSIGAELAALGNYTIIGWYDLANTTFRTQLIELYPVPYTVKNTVFVSKSGDDATGIAERPDKAFLTLAAAITAANALTPSPTQRIKIEVAAGNYQSNATLALPSWIDLDLGNATIDCTVNGSPTLELLGTSVVYGDGAAIINSANGTALFTNGVGNNSVINIKLVRGIIDMDLGGGFMQMFVGTITPTQTNTVSGFINATFINGSWDFESPNCFSGLEFGASTSSMIQGSLLYNGLAVSGDAFLDVYNSRIRRTITDTLAAAVSMTDSARLYLSNGRIDCTNVGLDGIYTDSNTIELRIRAFTIVAGTSSLSINNASGGAVSVKDYSAVTLNRAVGGISAVNDTIGTWIVSALVT
jgi:hypothetical protein